MTLPTTLIYHSLFQILMTHVNLDYSTRLLLYFVKLLVFIIPAILTEAPILGRLIMIAVLLPGECRVSGIRYSGSLCGRVSNFNGKFANSAILVHEVLRKLHYRDGVYFWYKLCLVFA